MKFKLDENVAASAGQLLMAAGHDVATVRQQGLTGMPDGHIAAVCRAEGRALVTEDLDFSDIRAISASGTFRNPCAAAAVA